MGIHFTDNRGRTYGLVGNTPVIRKPGSRFKANMLAAISPQGFMNWMVFEGTFDSKKFIEFLGRMRRQVNQKIFLIVDNLKSIIVKKCNFILRNTRMILKFFLPPYCPELNPQELANQEVKANCNHFKALKSIDDLITNRRLYLTKIQFNEFKIKNFFKKKEVTYAA